MPFTAEWWPARYLMAPLKEYFNRPILCLAEIKIHKGGIQGKTMACHLMAAEWKKGRCFMLLSVSNTQVFWQTAQSGGVRVCVRMCVCVFVLIFSPLLSPFALPLITETYCVIKKQTHQNTGCLQSCEKCSLGSWWLLRCSGSCGKKKAERWQECSTVSLKDIKGRVYHRNSLFHGHSHVCT